MANNRLGELRRSTVVMTSGPGSVVDFRVDLAPVSAIVAGLDEWEKSTGFHKRYRISEPRLQRKLSMKSGFRLPPVIDKHWGRSQENSNFGTLVAVRFPAWLQCPRCDRIAPARKWRNNAGQAYRYCADCTQKSPGRHLVYAVPTRFVIACAKGHLDDFPWHAWVGHKSDCNNKSSDASLFLKSERPGFSGLILRCPKCDAYRSMDGIFSEQVWDRLSFKCRGHQPWLAAGNEECNHPSRALQRGASNLYFPVIESALSIPPWSDVLQEALGSSWDAIVQLKPGPRADFIRTLAGIEPLKQVLKELNLNPDQLIQQIESRLTQYNDDSILNIRREEYRQLVSGSGMRRSPHADEFEVQNVSVPDKLRPFFSHIVRAVRLREVRVLRGFTRINPPGDEENPDIAAISAKKLDWLPAIEVRGEGIFMSFNQQTLRKWETQDSVLTRAQIVNKAYRNVSQRRNHADNSAFQISPRYLLVHTFAHALMRQLTLECGYSTASLRERLYVSDDEESMAGLLIYTATSDSDGTLGGLERQGKSNRIEQAVKAAIRGMEWCSSDPLCIQGIAASSDQLSLAACHACILAPETACEKFNRFLDRAMLVGLPETSAVGFFLPLIKNS